MLFDLQSRRVDVGVCEQRLSLVRLPDLAALDWLVEEEDGELPDENVLARHNAL